VESGLGRITVRNVAHKRLEMRVSIRVWVWVRDMVRIWVTFANGFGPMIKVGFRDTGTGTVMFKVEVGWGCGLGLGYNQRKGRSWFKISV